MVQMVRNEVNVSSELPDPARSMLFDLFADELGARPLQLSPPSGIRPPLLIA